MGKHAQRSGGFSKLSAKRYTLVIDSSLKGVSLGLFSEGARQLGYLCCHDTYGSSKFLTTGVQEILEEENLTVDRIANIVVAVGPGSFTGVKIGIAFAQGLTYGNHRHKVELFGVSSMMAFHRMGQRSEYVALPATKTQGYVFGEFGGILEHRILKKTSEGYRVVGADGRSEEFNKASTRILLPWDDLHATVGGQNIDSYSSVSQKILGSMSLIASEKLDAIGTGDKLLEPNYLRKPAAEERLDEKIEKA